MCGYYPLLNALVAQILKACLAANLHHALQRTLHFIITYSAGQASSLQ